MVSVGRTDSTNFATDLAGQDSTNAISDCLLATAVGNTHTVGIDRIALCAFNTGGGGPARDAVIDARGTCCSDWVVSLGTLSANGAGAGEAVRTETG